MFDGFPRRLTQLSRRLLHPKQAFDANELVQRTLRDTAELVAKQAPRPGSAFTATPFQSPPAAGGITEVTEFGDNPGRLRMLAHVPPRTPQKGAPLLVLLHGCGQDAAGFAAASGFIALADRLGAALLLPEQQASNNQGRCFNWFLPQHTTRGNGEAASIRHMVATALHRFDADPARVFIAGLSAGAALSVSLLAAYPEVFAGGAAVAGLPVGAAHDLGSAFNRMGRAAAVSRTALIAQVPVPPKLPAEWPRLSIWSGEADHTVDPANSLALAAQWTGLLGLPETPDTDTSPAPGLRRRAWGDAVEHWSLAGYGHAFPAAGHGHDPYVQPAPVQAAEAMAHFWGLSGV